MFGLLWRAAILSSFSIKKQICMTLNFDIPFYLSQRLWTFPYEILLSLHHTGKQILITSCYASWKIRFFQQSCSRIWENIFSYFFHRWDFLMPAGHRLSPYSDLWSQYLYSCSALTYYFILFQPLFNVHETVKTASSTMYSPPHWNK
jgi:hypothetical protein